MRIAIVGAGPVGLEAALRARREGHEVLVFESGRVAEHFARYGPVRLFTPFHMNSTGLGRELLAAAHVKLPEQEAILTATELRDRYLLPLSRLPELRGAIVENARVGAIAREGMGKGRTEGRGSRPFLLRVESAREDGPPFHRADIVIDASGVYSSPNATGPGGLAAPGEERLGKRLVAHLPDVLGRDRASYAGKRILLVGDGRSAANVIADLERVVRGGEDGERTRVEWIHRDRGPDAFAPVPATELERLPVLRELEEWAGRIVREAGWIRRHPGATIAAYRILPSTGVEVTLLDPNGQEERIEVDRVLALVGYRPDLEIFRELQVHLCYATEGPMALAAAILAGRSKDPAAVSGCLDQVSHGPDSLKSPEPGFYVLGAKSYGRNPHFLLAIAHQQIEDVMRSLSAEVKPQGVPRERVGGPAAHDIQP